MIVLIRWKNIIEVTWCHRNKAGLRLARIKKDFERRNSICFAKLQFASWCSFFVVLFWERLYWIRLNVQSDWLWCNFQVAEVLATVIKKEKEDETEKKGESRFSRLCPRQTLSILAPTVFLVEVSVLVRSDSRRILFKPNLGCDFFLVSIRGLLPKIVLTVNCFLSVDYSKVYVDHFRDNRWCLQWW